MSVSCCLVAGALLRKDLVAASTSTIRSSWLPRRQAESRLHDRRYLTTTPIRQRSHDKRQPSSDGRRSTSSTSTSEQTLSHQIRALMRNTAQPVAIITSFFPPSTFSKQQSTSSDASPPSLLVHGATLSSFTTISLDPPLVAFSFKLPSRMADALSSEADGRQKGKPRFIVNLLSHTQGDVAAGFARPGTKPFDLRRHPGWAKGSGERGNASATSPEEIEGLSPLAQEKIVSSQCAYGSEGAGVPILVDSLGSLACSLQGHIDLDMDPLQIVSPQDSSKTGDEEVIGEAAIGKSRLFLARIHAVEGGSGSQTGTEGDAERQEEMEKRPLLYWRQGFTTVE